MPAAPLTPDRPVLIYGTGSFGKDAYGVLRAAGYSVHAFLDQRGTGAEVLESRYSYPLHHPEISSLLRLDPVVVIGVFNPAADLRVIADAIRGAGFRDVVTPMAFYEAFSEQMGQRFWMAKRSFYQQHARQIAQGASLWADEESRLVYQQAVLFRAEDDIDALPEPDTGNQYFPPSLPRPQEPLRFVDGGAYTGDTLQDLMGHDLSVESVFVFEPDMSNFVQLTTQSRTTLAGRARCLAWPCGLWSSTTCLRFDAGGSASSRIDDQAADTISVVALDDVLQGERVNFVKLDIEGAEPEALLGAETLIRQQRPTLAVCAYHLPEHLYSIARQIEDFDLSYRFFLRSHAYNTFDLVCYALPA